MPYYDRTLAEKAFRTEVEARAAGYRRGDSSIEFEVSYVAGRSSLS